MNLYRKCAYCRLDVSWTRSGWRHRKGLTRTPLICPRTRGRHVAIRKER